MSGLRREDGQSTVEWIGLVLLVALALGGVLAALGARVPGAGLAEAIAKRIACAAGVGEGCLGFDDPELAAEYGPELAALVRARAPTLVYEEGMTALPVDFRDCREAGCGLGAAAGEVAATDGELPATLFVHVVDCRPGAEAALSEGYDCSGPREGGLYLQYWAYYPSSQSLRALRAVGNPGYHRDDWESFQVRVGPEGRLARASSHRGYNYRGGLGSWLSDAGVVPRSGWGPDRGTYLISGGSHAGRAHGPTAGFARWTPGERVRLLPVEALARGPHADAAFAVTPPWLKRVYRDPEHTGTD